MSKLSFKQILLIGVLIEILIFSIFYLLKDNIGDIFRYSARYSGRVSLIIYLYCFHLFYQSVLVKGSLKRLKELVYIFGVLHLIHFCFLALSVYLNDLPIIPVKVTGGALAYLMIILYPFVINKIKKRSYHLIYFYYVGIVMLLTYVSRIKGDFIGADPELFHKIAFVVLIFCFLFYGIKLYQHRKNLLN
ncbi:MAG: hypothetical protein ACJ0O5_05160 [Flavobacteriaceae bacterium]